MFYRKSITILATFLVITGCVHEIRPKTPHIVEEALYFTDSLLQITDSAMLNIVNHNKKVNNQIDSLVNVSTQKRREVYKLSQHIDEHTAVIDSLNKYQARLERELEENRQQNEKLKSQNQTIKSQLEEEIQLKGEIECEIDSYKDSINTFRDSVELLLNPPKKKIFKRK